MTNQLTVNFHGETLTHKQVWGSQYILVSCIATIGSEEYEIEYFRDPISGYLRTLTCKPRAEETTTENTLTCLAVEDICRDTLE